MIEKILLLALFCIFGIYDLKSKKVKNKAVAVALIPCVAVGCVLNGVGFTIKGALLGFFVTLGMFLLGALGAGDVKLFAVAGALVGASFIGKVIVCSTLFAGGVGAVVILMSLAKKKSLKDIKAMSLPFIPQSFVGVILAMIF